MSHSMYGADRGTHLKIVVISLLCATLVAMVGVFANVRDVGIRSTGASSIDLGIAPPFKAERTTMVSGRLPAIP